MDAPFAINATNVILAIGSALVALAVYFLKDLVTQTKKTNAMSIKYFAKVDEMDDQLKAVSRMREDIAVLKYAILGYLNKKNGDDAP